MDGMPYLFWWICHLEGLWGRCGAHNLATKAFAYISLSLNIYARPPDSLSKMIFDLSDALVALVCQLKNARTQCIKDSNTVVSQNNPTFLQRTLVRLTSSQCPGPP